MIVKSVMVVDMKVVQLSGLSTNLSELPGQVTGETVVLGPWEAVITTADDIVTKSPLSHPIVIYHDFGQAVRITAVRIRRLINNVEFFFNFLPVSTVGNIFDMRVEFYADRE